VLRKGVTINLLIPIVIVVIIFIFLLLLLLLLLAFLHSFLTDVPIGNVFGDFFFTPPHIISLAVSHSSVSLMLPFP